MNKYFKEILRPLKYIKVKYWVYIAALLAEGMAFPVVQILLSLSQKNLVNAVEFNDISYMKNVIVLSGIMVIVFLVINPLASYFLGREVFGFITKFRNLVLEHVIDLPVSFYDKNHSGDLLSKFNNDMSNIQWMYQSTLLRLLLGLFYGIFSIILMFILFWELSLVLIILGVIETWVITSFSGKIRKSSNFIQRKSGLNDERFLDIIKGFKVIRMFSISGLLLKKYTNENDDIFRESIDRNKTTLIVNGLNDIFVAVNLIGLLSLGVILYYNNYVDMGTVMAFLILQDGISYMIYNIGGYVPKIQENLAGTQRVIELLDEKGENEKRNVILSEVKLNENSSEHIICEKINFKYYVEDENETVLKNFSCKFKKGSITALAGQSGCGKTTLIKLLLGFYIPLSGSLVINGVDYRSLTLDEIRSNYSYVSQFPFLFRDTIMENIRCGKPKATDLEVIDAAKGAFADEFINKLPNGYNTALIDDGGNLSGGERQRIALARAILKNAPILILDEATTGIDSENEEYIYKFIDSMVVKGTTVILIAHRESSIKKADSVYIIKDGKVVSQYMNK